MEYGYDIQSISQSKMVLYHKILYILFMSKIYYSCKYYIFKHYLLYFIFYPMFYKRRKTVKEMVAYYNLKKSFFLNIFQVILQNYFFLIVHRISLCTISLKLYIIKYNNIESGLKKSYIS